MKIAIYTQIRENYGSVDEPYWKNKGGNTFVVPGITPAQAARVERDGIPTLTALLETSNEFFEEFVVHFSVVNDTTKVCDSWDTPFELRFVDGRWVATRTVENGEFGFMRAEVLRKTEEYDMVVGGGRANYRALYTLRETGEMVTDEEFAARMAA